MPLARLSVVVPLKLELSPVSPRNPPLVAVIVTLLPANVLLILVDAAPVAIVGVVPARMIVPVPPRA